MDKCNYPIGIIDSGKGGMGVIHYLSFALKNEDFLFYLDHENFPYGNKSRNEIIKIGNDATEVINRKVKLIIIACNTLSCYLDKSIGKPIFKINECIIEKILKIKKKKNVLFLTTSLTKKSNYFQEQCENYSIKYHVLACPSFVDMVENNEINYDKVKDFLKEEIDKDYNVIVLGCTHFYYLEEHIRKLFSKAKIVTGYDILKRKIKKYLKKNKLNNNQKNRSVISIIKK